MPPANRRRGGQPGNTNALKHGLYRNKPAWDSRPKGGQPGNLNRLLNGKYTCLGRPFRPPPVPRPPAVPLPPPAPLPPGCPGFSNHTGRPDRPRKTRPSASLAGLYSLLELQLLDLLDNPFYRPLGSLQKLYHLNAELIRLLRNLPELDPSPNPSGQKERKLQ